MIFLPYVRFSLIRCVMREVLQLKYLDISCLPSHSVQLTETVSPQHVLVTACWFKTIPLCVYSNLKKWVLSLVVCTFVVKPEIFLTKNVANRYSLLRMLNSLHKIVGLWSTFKTMSRPFNFRYDRIQTWKYKSFESLDFLRGKHVNII